MVPLFQGATKPKLYWGCDPKLFVPIGLLVVVGVVFFGHNILALGACFGLAALTFMAGKIMGRWSPFFIDETIRWFSWRMRTGSGPFAADACFYARDSDEAKKWRKR